MPDKPRDDQHEREMPPIPDGGLSTSMPDWLRRPPAWRALPDHEVKPSSVAGSVTLPEIDASVIDPRSFIHDDDLPGWLRSMRRPAPIAEPESAGGVEGSGSPPVQPTEAVEAADEPAIVGVNHRPVAFQPRRPAIVATSLSTTTSVSPAVRAFASRPSPARSRSRWEQRVTTLVLGIALVISLLVILILVAW